jgi:hypothetical protein
MLVADQAGHVPSPRRANEFAATTTQSPPARTRRPGGLRRPRRLRVRNRGDPPAPLGANEFAATTSHSPPARTRRPGGVRRPEHRRVRYQAACCFACRSARHSRPQSAKADFALFQRRIHSLLVGTRRPRGLRRSEHRRVRNKAGGLLLCVSKRTALAATVREGGLRVVPAANSFAHASGHVRYGLEAQRHHSLLVRTRRPGGVRRLRAAARSQRGDPPASSRWFDP